MGSLVPKELGQSPLPRGLEQRWGLASLTPQWAFWGTPCWGCGCCVGSVGTKWALSLQPDLISTIGESAALGAAGAIFWGDADYTKNRVGLGSACF